MTIYTCVILLSMCQFYSKAMTYGKFQLGVLIIHYSWRMLQTFFKLLVTINKRIAGKCLIIYFFYLRWTVKTTTECSRVVGTVAMAIAIDQTAGTEAWQYWGSGIHKTSRSSTVNAGFSAAFSQHVSTCLTAAMFYLSFMFLDCFLWI